MPVQSAAAPQPAEPVVAANDAPDQAPHILQVDQQIAQPAWYKSMFNEKDKQAASANAPSEAVAVNKDGAGENTLNTAQNSGSAPEKTPAAEVNAASAEAPESSSGLPSLASVAAPITQVLTGDANMAASAASALPSPKILQEIKMMPSSRYTARVRSGTLQDTH
jgi:hypothetical protein